MRGRAFDAPSEMVVYEDDREWNGVGFVKLSVPTTVVGNCQRKAVWEAHVAQVTCVQELLEGGTGGRLALDVDVQRVTRTLRRFAQLLAVAVTRHDFRPLFLCFNQFLTQAFCLLNFLRNSAGTVRPATALLTISRQLSARGHHASIIGAGGGGCPIGFDGKEDGEEKKKHNCRDDMSCSNTGSKDYICAGCSV
jgi:hypothetical protein